ncbi:MAG: energy transducer TonB [Bryobacteraceae bacterium]|jgi:TonB family protein
MLRRLWILAGLVALAGWVPVQAQQTLKLIHTVAPKYPQEAKDKKIEGDVVLHIEINAEGEVHDPWVVSGPKELRDATLEAVKQWKYSKDGPLPASSEVTLAFQLPKKD